MPKAVPGLDSVPEIDKSLQSWLYNIRHVLNFPLTVLGVAGLLVAGTFAESAPRKSLEFLNNYLGRALFFLIPLSVAYGLDWATGLLAAVVALIFFARLQVHDDVKEGFMDEMTTEIIPTSRRWFVEKVLGERPIAISSDRIRRSYSTLDEDSRTSSSSSMATTGSSDSSSHK
jgi:phosphotransferase system  glucose/maltose/N-acetylglucosamine-specific IIC component